MDFAKSAQVLPVSYQSKLRLALSHAIRSARGFDGSDEGLDKLVAAISPMEEIIREIGSLNEAAEECLTRQARGRNNSSMSVSQLLDLAIASFGRKLSKNTIVLPVIKTDLVFLPSLGQALIETGSEKGIRSIRLESRMNQILVFLAENSVSTSDYRIFEGQVLQTAMRQVPYRIIQIPRFNREIAVCDQAGQATYVSSKLVGPLFWATYRKEQLRKMPEVTRVRMGDGWRDRLFSAFFSDNVSGPKNALARSLESFPLSEDIILTKALEWAADPKHSLRLPSQDSGEIPGLPGQTWATWNQAVRNCGRGLNRPNCSGLVNVFQIYGLKIGRRENAKIVKQAIANLEAGKPHGLKIGQPNNGLLSENLILTKALEWAADPRHGGHLPSRASGPVPGLNEESWNGWNTSLRQRLRGLTREDCRGLNHLYQIYGLKLGKLENLEVLLPAVTKLRADQPHGLLAQPERPTLPDSRLGKESPSPSQ